MCNAISYLRLIAAHECLIVIDAAAGRDGLARDRSIVTNAHGSPLELSPLSRHASGVLEVPPEIMKAFHDAMLIKSDRLDSARGRRFYRLTDEGRSLAAIGCAARLEFKNPMRLPS